MKNTITVLLTILIIAAINLGVALFLSMSFIDVSIPVGGIAIIIIYFFISKGSLGTKHLDMSIQGRTGIRMEQKTTVTERSYSLIGSILYVAVMLVITFVFYREYFIGMDI